MAKIEGIIKSEITRLAKREVRSFFLPLKREVRQIGVRLSGLSKGVASLNRMSKELHLGEARPKLEATTEEVKASRLTPERISRLRRKLGISQREMGMLTGASLGAVQSWEKGKFRPKGEKKAALVALRKMKKGEVKKLLGEKAKGPKGSGAEGKGTRRERSRKGATRTQKPTARQRKPGARKPRKAV